MTHALAHWFWRLAWIHPAPDRPSAKQPPMKIAVERLPDYLWRDLGFRQVRRPEDDPWQRIQ